MDEGLGLQIRAHSFDLADAYRSRVCIRVI